MADVDMNVAKASKIIRLQDLIRLVVILVTIPFYYFVPNSTRKSTISQQPDNYTQDLLALFECSYPGKSDFLFVLDYTTFATII